MAAGAAIPTPAGQEFGGNASLYVGDLDSRVNEGQLYDVFNQVAQVVSVRVCRDQATRVSLGYAYVNFCNAEDAYNARERLNFTLINGKPIRIMFLNQDPTIWKSGFANVFIKNLDTSLDSKALQNIFVVFGTVLSCKVATDANGRSKGYGFVQFDRDEAAQNAIEQLNGKFINSKKVYVGHFVRREERNRPNGSPKFTNVYVKNFSETTTEEDLTKIFGKYGPITSAVVMRDVNGGSRCFGFVNFQSPDDAASAVENLNGTSLNDEKVLYVGRAQRKADREAELRANFEQERKSRFEKLRGANLYLKNLDDSITDEKLKELFSEFGNITSCKVMRNPQGMSIGSAFVAFSSPEEATSALIAMNGEMIGRKPLYVAVAQRKEERRVLLQAHFAQLQAASGVAPLRGMPRFHPASSQFAPQPLSFSQSMLGLLPPQPAGYGFQQQLLPGMYPSVAQNFVLPFQLQRQRQFRQQVVTKRGGGINQQMQQLQWMHRNSNQGLKYVANARLGMDPSTVPQGLMGQMRPTPSDVSEMSATPLDVQQQSGPVPMSSLASALASATPENQRSMLREQLCPLVEQLEHEQAGKLTDMLLEMDKNEVLHLIESPDALKNKVSEALDVLRLASSGSDAGDQIGLLSLN